MAYGHCPTPNIMTKGWKQSCGSGIRCFFTPWIRDKFFPNPRSRIPYLFDYDLDPESIRSKKEVSLHSTFHLGSGMKKGWLRIRDEKMVGYGIWDKTSRIRSTKWKCFTEIAESPHYWYYLVEIEESTGMYRY
jgi:hypothetical protein